MTALFARARGLAERLLTDECFFISRAWVKNSTGGGAWVEGIPRGPYRCSLQAEQAAEPQEGGRTVGVTVWTLYLPVETAIDAKDIATVNGTRYEVVESDAGRTDGLTLAVSLRRAA